MAELKALIVTFERGLSPIRIYSDSAYVVDGVAKGPRYGHHHRRVHGRHWKRLWTAVSAWGEAGPDTWQVIKVKGHATSADVDKGLATEFLRKGNAMADAAAKRGALCHQSIEKQILARGCIIENAVELGKWMGEAVAVYRELLGDTRPARQGITPAARTRASALRTPALSISLHIPALDRKFTKHHVVREVTFDDQTVCVACFNCGAYAELRSVHLAGPCNGTPDTASQLKRLKRGVHPSRMCKKLVTGSRCLPVSAVDCYAEEPEQRDGAQLPAANIPVWVDWHASGATDKILDSYGPMALPDMTAAKPPRTSNDPHVRAGLLPCADGTWCLPPALGPRRAPGGGAPCDLSDWREISDLQGRDRPSLVLPRMADFL